MAFKGSSVEKSMAEPRWRSLLFSRKASHGLGVALIIFGSLQILVQTSLLILETLFVQIKDVHRVSCWISGTTGIWCGFGIVVGGVVAIVAGRKGTRSWIRANNIFSVVAFLLACLIIVSSGFYVLDLISDRGRITPGNCENQTVSTSLPIDLGSEMEATTQPLENPPSNRNVTSSGNLYWKTMSGSGTTKATWSRISEDSSGRMQSDTTAEAVKPTKSTTTRSWWYLIEDYPNVDDEDNYIDSGDKTLSTATTTKPATHSSFDVFEGSGYDGQVDDDGDDDDEGDYDDYFENYNVTGDVTRSDRLLRIRREDPNLDREECLHQNFFWWIVALTHLSLLTLTGVVEVLLTVVSGSNSCLSLCRGPSEDLDHYIMTLSRPGSDEDCPLLTDLYPNKDDFTSARGLIDV